MSRSQPRFIPPQCVAVAGNCFARLSVQEFTPAFSTHRARARHPGAAATPSSSSTSTHFLSPIGCTLSTPTRPPRTLPTFSTASKHRTYNDACNSTLLMRLLHGPLDTQARGEHLSPQDLVPPPQFPLTPLFSYSYALFCTGQSAILILFSAFRTLLPKHRGRVMMVRPRTLRTSVLATHYSPVSIHFFPNGNKLGSAGGVSAIASNFGNCCRSGSGTFTFEPFKMLMSCRALTTPFP
jgi:hypothetical protein